MMSGADDLAIEVMTEFGERIGVAFQLADDLLDIGSDSEVSGKTAGTDLREGVRTLPVLMALAGTDAQDARLRELLAGPLGDDDEHAEALRLLRAHSAMDQARDEARRWSDDARRALQQLPESAVREALESLCDQVVGRTS